MFEIYAIAWIIMEVTTNQLPKRTWVRRNRANVHINLSFFQFFSTPKLECFGLMNSPPSPTLKAPFQLQLKNMYNTTTSFSTKQPNTRRKLVLCSLVAETFFGFGVFEKSITWQRGQILRRSCWMISRCGKNGWLHLRARAIRPGWLEVSINQHWYD